MRSANGELREGRRSAPVFHLRKLSRTRPSQGFRKTSHGSQHDLGVTETEGYVL